MSNLQDINESLEYQPTEEDLEAIKQAHRERQMSDFQDVLDRADSEGYMAGLQSPNGMHCPYDGRTKAGKVWWKGFIRGDAERCVRHHAAKRMGISS